MPEPAIRAAVEAVQVAEAALGLSATGQEEFHVGRRTVHRPGADGLPVAEFADPLVRNLAGTPDRVLLACRSAVIASGKFHRPGREKGRGYLRQDGVALSLKSWRIVDAAMPGRRERRQRAAAARIADYRGPEMLASGDAGGFGYVLERAVLGRHPADTEQRCAAVADLMPSLARAYVAHGVRHRGVGRILHRKFAEGFRGVLTAPDLPWDRRWGDREQVLAAVLRLVDRDRSLPCAFGHGDLVATNIIRTPDGSHVLIDWEFAKVMPIAFDLGKLLFTSRRPERMTALLNEHVQPFSGTGRRVYRWHEQLAIGLASFLSHSAKRRERAREAGLLTGFDRDLTQRLRWLSSLVLDS